jgi:hypothetical protein
MRAFTAYSDLLTTNPLREPTESPTSRLGIAKLGEIYHGFRLGADRDKRVRLAWSRRFRLGPVPNHAEPRPRDP